MDIRVPSNPSLRFNVSLSVDGCKPAVCFHNGFWLMYTFYPYLVTSKDKNAFDTHVEDYCNEYSEKLAARYTFVQDMMPLVQDK